jgi:two-component system KDP operon response regulator KdpE
MDPLRVLAVDDEPDLRKLLEVRLGAEGFETRFAASAEEGLDLVAEWSPGVVLLDLMMPRRDGWWFLRELKKREMRRPAVIILSARSGEAERLIATTFQVASYVTKPFDVEDLVRAIHRLEAGVLQAAEHSIEAPVGGLAVMWHDEG